LKFGEFEVQSISGGRFRLDGGAMFGVVPKTLWNRKSESDELNRVQLDTNCLLVRTPDAIVLCDTGFGSKLSEKQLSFIDAAPGNALISHLNSNNLDRGDVTHVIFSHLHFDHVGGATCLNSGGELEVTFPNAVHIFQEKEMADAIGMAAELEGNYYDAEIRFWSENAKCQPVSGDSEIINGIFVQPTGGHTAGHQLIEIKSGDQHGIFLGDICPTSAHLNVFWTMAYDAFQLDVRRKKAEILDAIANSEVTLFFDHDPNFQASTIFQKNKKTFEIKETFDLR
jgi:glyoxylase-like metal-dependent hydrolase (beta-lactamase superfamily II)